MNVVASPSPVIEAGRVYVHFGTYGTACVDTNNGKKLWERRDLTLDHKEGAGSSPALFGDLLILHCDGQDVQYVVALDKQTGKTKWKTDRSADFRETVPYQRKAYATPLVADLPEGRQLLSVGARAAYGYDPATGIYTPRIAMLLRVAAAIGVILLSSSVLLLIRAGKRAR